MFLWDSCRDELQIMYNPPKRKVTDKRNSNSCKLTIWQECCDDYNSSLWEPYSIKFPKLYITLSVAMCLSFY